MRRRWPTSVVVLLLLGLVVPLAGSAAAASPVSALPATPAQQLAWVLDASHRAPISAVEQARHLAPAFRKEIGTTAFNQTLTDLGPLRARFIVKQTPASVEAVTAGPKQQYLTELAVGSDGLVNTLRFAPYLSASTSWAQIDSQLRALAPQVSFAATEINSDGQCRPVHGLNADTQRPLGSTFKLYVLGALGHAVATHRASWDEPLAIHEDWKSLPSGQLQNKPAGTKFTLRQYADYMISISDNTAADHLIHFLGRDTVARQLSRFGNQHPSTTIPFPTTRELFALKGTAYPGLADAYLATPRPWRETVLDTVDRIPLSGIRVWTRPEMINQIEWFASPSDICQAFAGLERQDHTAGLAPIGQALSINDGGLALNPKRYPVVWFKGGSEPGVLTLTYLTRTASGKVLVSSVMLGDTGKPLDEQTAAMRAQAIIRGAFALATP